MPDFDVIDGGKVTVRQRQIDPKYIDGIKHEPPGWWESAGCYIFAMQKSQQTDEAKKLDYLPIYVGKSSTKLGPEIFSSEKLKKIDHFLLDNPRDELRLFLIVHPPQKGPTNSKAIDEIETFLIQLAERVNPKIINHDKRDRQKWGIKGVIRSKQQGRRATPEKELRHLLGLDGG